MRGLSNTIAKLGVLQTMRAQAMPHAGLGRLGPLVGFGSNPGALLAKTFIPEELPHGAPLVVVLHGCTQTAEGFDHGSGWSELADEMGFALLFPEQTRANNPNLCFNWYQPGDVTRGAGEVASIRQMIAAMVDAHDLDPRRVFVTGLSAGGAMTSALLATYPEVFAGGAIIAGLPYGRAESVPQAFEQMRAASAPGGDPAASVRSASPHTGPWPRLSIWHGRADRVVDASNATAIIEQWRSLHGLEGTAARQDNVDGHVRKRWFDKAGQPMIEFYDIAGMDHGVPLATRGKNRCGATGPFMLEAGISSTRHIARSWELEGAVSRPARRSAEAARPEPASVTPKRAKALHRNGPAQIIGDALRAAGLLK